MTDMFQNKKVLVAGGMGFVGQNLIHRLLRLGATVKATYHKKPPAQELEHQHVKFVNADLTSPIDCAKAVENVDYVFMCAANTSGAHVIEHTPLAHLTPNMVMNLYMLEKSYEAGVKKFLFISSNTVYPVSEVPVAESDVTDEFFHKYHIVAWMKRFSEIVCEMYSTKINNPMETVVVRPANIYGPRDDFEWETSHVIPALIRKVVERHQPIEVWGDGQDLKEVIYIDDFVDGMLLAMERLNSFEPINIARGEPSTVSQVINHLVEIDGFADAKVVYDVTKPSMIKKRLINPDKAINEIGFRADTPLIEGLRQTIDWYKLNR